MGKRENLLKVCQTYAGTHTPFNQSWTEIKNQRLLSQFYNDKTASFHDKIYIGGMCHTMSSYWLALRSEGKVNFFDWLKPRGSWSKAAINVLVVKTGMYKNSMNKFVPVADEEDFDNRFFEKYGLRRYGTTVRGKDAILNYLERQTGGSHMISVSGATGGHAIAASFSPTGGSAFFDPNYGEYAFLSSRWATDFIRYFKKESGYRDKYTEFRTLSYH